MNFVRKRNILRPVEILCCVLLVNIASIAKGGCRNEETLYGDHKKCTVRIKNIDIFRCNNTTSLVYKCGFDIEIATAERGTVRICSVDVDDLLRETKFFFYDTRDRSKRPFEFQRYYDGRICALKFSTYRITSSDSCSVTVWNECTFTSLDAIPSELGYEVAYNNDNWHSGNTNTTDRVIIRGNGLTYVTKSERTKESHGLNDERRKLSERL